MALLCILLRSEISAIQWGRLTWEQYKSGDLTAEIYKRFLADSESVEKVLRSKPKSLYALPVIFIVIAYQHSALINLFIF